MEDWFGDWIRELLQIHRERARVKFSRPHWGSVWCDYSPHGPVNPPNSIQLSKLTLWANFVDLDLYRGEVTIGASQLGATIPEVWK